ncbi:hypothetical protein L4C34_02275 [Vibrio profundum]|uniref:hypothetical protein n=1 Tax=Vibrio profundum TaxID=2910247 RepID=UPI003D0D4C7C
MIQCGLNALMKGIDSEHMVLLASASHDSNEEVVELFKRACAEVSIPLPSEHNSNFWLARTALELKLGEIELPNQSTDEIFKRNLLVVFSELKLACQRESSLTHFTNELGKLLEITGYIDDYQEWLENFIELSNRLEISPCKQIICDVVDLTNYFSYSSATKDLVDESYRLATMLVQVNQKLEESECDECASHFIVSKSQMVHLCPECAHYLYNYDNCEHIMADGYCSVCKWDGSTSSYVEILKSTTLN